MVSTVHTVLMHVIIHVYLNLISHKIPSHSPYMKTITLHTILNLSSINLRFKTIKNFWATPKIDANVIFYFIILLTHLHARNRVESWVNFSFLTARWYLAVVATGCAQKLPFSLRSRTPDGAGIDSLNVFFKKSLPLSAVRKL